jgi:pantetheine hydrolase
MPGMARLYLCLVVHISLWSLLWAEVPVTRTKFKAAVYGHAVIPPPEGKVSRQEAVRYMRRNLEVYRKQASEARRQGADILVFPEDGIYGTSFTRESVYNYLENIPLPLEPPWSPCSEPDLHPQTDVLRELSCLAKNNSLYIIANMGDKQPCDNKTDPKCPKDGRYQFNTDVAFDPNGTVIARYHKYHLFYEEQFDTPTAEIVTFNTSFGTFGMMVCFDVLFHEPGLPMILKEKVANVVFPTAWMDALPLLSALGFHSSFARALGVNFLSADVHNPSARMHGSGIYSPDGMKASYYGSAPTSLPRLLVAELNVLNEPQPAISKTAHGGHLDPDCDWIRTDVPNLQPDEFYSELFHDNFTFKVLTNRSGSLRVCQKDVCCSLQYTIADNPQNEIFAFGAFDGLHTYEGQYYFQICALVKCSDARNRSTCGAVADVSNTTFTELRMDGQMLTPFIYPQLLMSDGRGEILLTRPEVWSFKNSSLRTNTALDHPLLSAALYGRFYSRDSCSGGNSRMLVSSRDILLLVLSSLAAVLIFKSS